MAEHPLFLNSNDWLYYCTRRSLVRAQSLRFQYSSGVMRLVSCQLELFGSGGRRPVFVECGVLSEIRRVYSVQDMLRVIAQASEIGTLRRLH